MSLSFRTLRTANIARLSEFKNAKGELAHSSPDGSDWSPAQWLQALVGEVGEYANLRKKYERGDFDKATFVEAASKELADIQIYLDLLAYQLGIDLAEAVTQKFNEVTLRAGCTVYIKGDDWHLLVPPKE